jgi:hypothetical protein
VSADLAPVLEAIRRLEGQLAERSLGWVSLERFAAAAGLAAKTIRNDLTSSDVTRRRRWPRFVRTPAGTWCTTERDIEAWRASLPSNYGGLEVEDRLSRRRSA